MAIFRLRRAFGAKTFDTSSSTWDGVTTTYEVTKSDFGQDLRGLDLQIHVDALAGTTWHVEVKCEGSQEYRLYNDNGGAGFDSDGIVLIDAIHVTHVKVILAGGAAVAPVLIINWNRRGM